MCYSHSGWSALRRQIVCTEQEKYIGESPMSILIETLSRDKTSAATFISYYDKDAIITNRPYCYGCWIKSTLKRNAVQYNGTM